MSKLQQTNIELPIKYSGYGVMDFRSLLGQRRGYVFREKFVKSPPRHLKNKVWSKRGYVFREKFVKSPPHLKNKGALLFFCHI